MVKLKPAHAGGVVIVVVPFALLSATLAHEAVGLPACIRSGETSPVPQLRDALDDTALAGCVAALEQNHVLVAGLRLPVLRSDQLCLQAKDLLKVAKAQSPIGFEACGAPWRWLARC